MWHYIVCAVQRTICPRIGSPTLRSWRSEQVVRLGGKSLSLLSHLISLTFFFSFEANSHYVAQAGWLGTQAPLPSVSYLWRCRCILVVGTSGLLPASLFGPYLPQGVADILTYSTLYPELSSPGAGTSPPLSLYNPGNLVLPVSLLSIAPSLCAFLFHFSLSDGLSLPPSPCMVAESCSQ